jgi:pimeloyl-ACP methyl ester carboxylesterase
MSGWSSDWMQVQRAIAVDTRACAYDRAGYGWSNPAPGPPDASATVQRLHQLLAAARIEPPFILVGHSLGGLYVQAFAERFPRDVAGVVLVDSVHRRQSAAMPAARRDYERRLLRLTRWSAAIAPSGLLRLAARPASIVAHKLDPNTRETAVAFAYRSSSYKALAKEMAAFRTTQAQVRPLPRALPLTVLGASEIRDYPPGFGPAEQRVWNGLQARHASGGNAVQVVPGSGHYIHLDRPAVVVAAIRAQVAAQR